MPRRVEVMPLAAFQLLGSPLSTPPRKDPFVVRGGRQKVLVSATLENRKENAYNASLNLSFSRNLHLASFTPQVPGGGDLGGVREGGGGRLGYWPRLQKALEKGSVLRGCGQETLDGFSSSPRHIPLPSEGQSREGGMHSPFPSCPALQCGAPCLSGWSQGE